MSKNTGFLAIGLTSLLVALAGAASGCGGSTDTTSTTAPSTTYLTDTLTGTVPPPVNNVLQSAFNTFVVGQGGGTVTITLTSAIETLPDKTLLTTVAMGLGVGTVTGATCTLMANAYTIAQASSTAQLSGSLSAGTYCVQVSDVTSQLGPVAYAVAVVHP